MRSIALVQYGSVNSLILKLFGANRVARVPHGRLAVTLLGRHAGRASRYAAPEECHVTGGRA